MATNIDDLLNKRTGDELSAEEFDRLAAAVKENQSSVRAVKLGGLDPAYPDTEGLVTLQLISDDWTDVFRVQRKVTRNYEEVWETVTDNMSCLYKDNDVPMRLQFREYRQQEIDGEIEYESSNAPLVIKILKSTVAGETEVARMSATAQAYDSTRWEEFNLSNYLSSGSNDLIIEVSGGLKGEVSRRAFTVIAANLSLTVSDDHNWATKAFVLGSASYITAEYYAAGSADRTLCVTFTGADGTSSVFRQSISASAGSSSPVGIIFTQVEDTVDFFTEGVQTVTAWLEATVGDDTVKSDTVVSHVIVVESDSENDYVAIQDCITSMLNYESATMFRYNIYSPDAPADVTFVLADSTKQTIYLEVPLENRENNTVYDFASVLSIQSQYESIRVYIYAKVNGTYVNSGSSLSDFLVDNSEDYGAVEGADFFLNPALRNNQESNPARIINAMTGNEISGSVFTNVTFEDGVDGWMIVSGRRVLRLLAGATLTIPYDIYSEFTDNANHGLTIEIDSTANNITDETSAQITIGNGLASNPKGLYLKSMNGAFVTKSNNAWESVDVSWQEGVRTHKTFTYQHNYVLNNPEPGRGHSQTARLAIEKAYIAGVAEKTFRVTNTSDPTEINAGGNIVITPTGCDIDIYGIRIYKRALTAEQVKKNHRSTLNTTAEKKADFDANDIMVDGRVSLAKCLAAGYDCMVWHGKHISRQYPANPKRYGKADIYRHNADKTLDRVHTGTLYGIEGSGQGTTAMTYAEWNPSHKEDKGTGEGHDEYKYNDNGTLRNVFVDIDGNIGFGKTKFGYQIEDGDPIAKKLVGKINYASSMQSHKEGACNMYNDLYRICVATEGSGYSFDPTKCITNFSQGQRVTVKERPFFYFVQETEGADDAYAVFKGLMTYGPGKADKPTWGVTDESLVAGDSLIEGALNNNPLTDMRVPFVDTINPITGRYINEYQIKDDQGNKVEAFVYAGGKNLNWGFGDTLELHDTNSVVWDGVREGDKTNADAPTTMQVKMWQPIYNFLYLVNTRFQPWSGTLRELNIAVQTPSFDGAVAYWMTQDGDNYAKFDLFRCHYEADGSRVYVPAGIRLRQGNLTYTNFGTLYDLAASPTGVTEYTSSDLWYDVSDPTTATRDITFNLRTELNSMITKYGIGSAINYNDDATIVNTSMRKMMCRVARLFIENNIYLHKKSNLFHHEIMVLWAGTDNRSKNTYYRLNPYAVQTVNGVSHNWPNMEMNDDDLDTILKTNNVGIQSKPYYALETDTDPVLGTKYWQGQDNVLNNLLQDAYGYGYLETEEINLTLSNMMGSIFSAMTSLATGKTMPDGTPVEASPAGCFDYYFFSVQKYFPAMAYNETGRIRYEIPSMLYWDQTAPEGAEGEDYPEDPMNQSLGDQYDSEKDYVRRRVIMLAGYAGYRMNQFGFRGYAGTFTVTLKPHQYLYPMYEVGDQQSSRPTRSMQRVAPGTSFPMTFNNPSATNGVYFFFIGSMKEIGNIGSWGNGSYSDEASATALAPSGTRLVKFEMYSEQAEGVVFNPRSGTFDLSACRNLEEINVRNAYRLTGLLGLTNLVRLESVDARGTAITSLTLPDTPMLEELRLPSGYQTLSLRRTPNLSLISVQDYSSMQSISILSSVAADTKQFVTNCMNGGAQLQTLVLRNIQWTDVSTALMTYITNIPNVSLTGSIAMAQTAAVSFALKKKIIELFGNVDDDNNALTMTYNRVVLTSVDVSGDGYFSEVGEVKHYDITPFQASQNSIIAYRWEIDSEHSEWATVDELGKVTCLQMDPGTRPDGTTGTIYLEVDCLNASGEVVTRTAQMDIRFYRRNAKIGDYVYNDGTFDDRLNRSKTVVGICFYVNPDDETDRRMVALQNITSFPWGLYPTGTDSPNTNGFPSTGDNQLKYYPDGQPDGVAPFDIDNLMLPNVTSAGCIVQTTYTDPEDNVTYQAGTARARVRYETMIDPESPDGDFVEYPDRDDMTVTTATVVAVGRGLKERVELGAELKAAFFADDETMAADTLVPRGLHDTLTIVLHRSKVLNGTSWIAEDDETYPGTTFEPDDQTPGDVTLKMQQIREFAASAQGLNVDDGQTDNMSNKYAQYLYPAASAAHAYTPTVASGVTLNPKIGLHRWYLPSEGELARLAFYHLVGKADSIYHDSRVPDIFYNAANALVGFTRFTASYYWSSTEGIAYNAWTVNFHLGYIGYYNKYSSMGVRAVAAF